MTRPPDRVAIQTASLACWASPSAHRSDRARRSEPSRYALPSCEHARAEAVLAGGLVLGDEVVRLQGAQQPVHGRLGQAEPVGDLGDAEARRAGAEDVEDLGSALHRLDHDTFPLMSFSHAEQHSG